jgi:hypothetical protein
VDTSALLLLREATLQEYVAALVDRAPALTPEQACQLRRLLEPPSIPLAINGPRPAPG